MMEWHGWHLFTGCLEDMQGKVEPWRWCAEAGHSRGARKLKIKKSSFFPISRLGGKGEGWWCTFACFDLALLDFFLPMIVLNQSPDPMALTNRVRCSGKIKSCSGPLDYITRKTQANKLARICCVKTCKRIKWWLHVTAQPPSVDHGIVKFTSSTVGPSFFFWSKSWTKFVVHSESLVR
jgi:hypothetical protein